MPRRVTDGASLDLEKLICLALPICQEAGVSCPRTGPGPKPTYSDSQIAVMIMCGVLKKKKSKSAQYRFVQQHAEMIKRLLALERIPARSSFFARYQQVDPVVQKGIELQGRAALREHVADARVVAADKSLMRARGPEWNQKDRKRKRVPKYLHGLDREATWGKSDYHGWTYGYSYEVVVTATKDSVILPLLASVDVGSTNEHKSVVDKLDRLPPSTREVLIDPGYDSNDLADRVELDKHENPTGRHYVCPPQKGYVSEDPRTRTTRAATSAASQTPGVPAQSPRPQTLRPSQGDGRTVQRHVQGDVRAGGSCVASRAAQQPHGSADGDLRVSIARALSLEARATKRTGAVYSGWFMTKKYRTGSDKNVCPTDL